MYEHTGHTVPGRSSQAEWCSIVHAWRPREVRYSVRDGGRATPRREVLLAAIGQDEERNRGSHDMVAKHFISRRRFLVSVGGLGATALLAACSQSAPASPTAAPSGAASPTPASAAAPTTAAPKP